MKFLLNTLCLFVPLLLMAQTGSPSLNITNSNSVDYIRVSTTLNQLSQKEYEPTMFESEDVTGSIYFNDKFETITVLVDAVTAPVNYSARYNVYDNLFELKNDDGSISALLKVDFATIKTPYGTFKALDAFDERAVIVKQYFEILIDAPERKLLKKHYKTVKKGRLAKSSFDVDKSPEIVTATKIYLKEGLEAPREVKKVKDITSLFPDYTEAQLRALFK